MEDNHSKHDPRNNTKKIRSEHIMMNSHHAFCEDLLITFPDNLEKNSSMFHAKHADPGILEQNEAFLQDIDIKLKALFA